MRVNSFFLHCAILSGAACARDAYLYTFDQSPRTSPDRSSIISSDTAYTIVARRRGSPENRYLANIKEEVLDQINSYSGYQQSVFEYAEENGPRSKLFIRIIGHDGGEPAYLPSYLLIWLSADAPESSQSYLTILDVGRKFLTDLKPTKEEYCVYGSSGGYEYSLDVNSREEYSYNTIATVSSLANYLRTISYVDHSPGQANHAL